MSNETLCNSEHTWDPLRHSNTQAAAAAAAAAAGGNSKTSAAVAGTKSVTAAAGQQSSTDLEEKDDNWPEVDLGNLLTDLDADIDKMSSASGSNSAASASSSSSSAPSVSSRGQVKTLTSINSGSSGTATMTETRLADPAGAAGPLEGSSDKDKGLKMKIKRSKAGRHNEGGKLEIVQGQAGAGASAAGGQAALESTAGPATNSIFMFAYPT